MNDTATGSDQLVERLFGDTLGALELLSVYLGWRLDLYRTLNEQGSQTPPGFADRAGIDARYAREWLEQQATAGFLTVDDVRLDADARRYSLPADHADVLVDPESLSHVAPFAAMVVGIADALPDVVAAYRTGAGVPYTRYGVDFRDGQGAINRPAYHHDLAGWIQTMPDVDTRLRDDPPARIADLGCGQGWSTIALARAYPNAEVIGVDSDDASIVDAAERARNAGVNISFMSTDAGLLDGTVDLACIFEALHDMAKPIEVLEAARRALTATGALLIVDERVEDRFTAPGGDVERVMYGWSVLHCLPASRAETPSAALGTMLRGPTVEILANEAGFANVEILDIKNDFFRHYRLTR